MQEEKMSIVKKVKKKQLTRKKKILEKQRRIEESINKKE